MEVLLPSVRTGFGGATSCKALSRHMKGKVGGASNLLPHVRCVPGTSGTTCLLPSPLLALVDARGRSTVMLQQRFPQAITIGNDVLMSWLVTHVCALCSPP